MHTPIPRLGADGLRVARLTKPHGLKGGIKVELYTDSPATRFVVGAVFHLQVPETSVWFDRTISVKEFRWVNDAPVVFFAEITDRSAAESIVRAILWIDGQTVRNDREENAWYDGQLVGLAVMHDDKQIGTVAEVQHLPAQDLLVVATAHGQVLVPFVQAIVPQVDIDAGTVTVTPPDGLFVDSQQSDDAAKPVR